MAARRAWSECLGEYGYSNVEGAQSLASTFDTLDRNTAFVDAFAVGGAEMERVVSELRAPEVEAALAQVECDRVAYGPVMSEWATLEERWAETHRDEIAALPEQFRMLWGAYNGF